MTGNPKFIVHIEEVWKGNNYAALDNPTGNNAEAVQN